MWALLSAAGFGLSSPSNRALAIVAAAAVAGGLLRIRYALLCSTVVVSSRGRSETCVFGPNFPQFVLGEPKIGGVGGHLMPDDMGHWMGDAVGHLVGGVSRFRGTQAKDTASCLMHKKKGVRQKVNMVVLRLLKALPLLALGWFCLSLKIQSHDSCTRKQGFM